MVTIAGFLLIPFAVVSIFRRRLALLLTLVSIPFFALDIGYFLDHFFSFPEVIIIALLLNQMLHMYHEDVVILPVNSPIYLLIAFGIVSILSVFALLVNPLEVMTHSYNFSTLDGFRLSPIEFTRNNISQLLLRLFVVAAIIGLSVELSHYDLEKVIRLVIVISLLVGGFGVFYQITQQINATGIWALAATFGLDIMTNAGGFLGTGIPRMWTVAGEPGQTASYLLYAFSLVVTLSFLPETRVLSRTQLRLTGGALFFLLILTTSATAYGGLLIFAALFSVSSIIFDAIPLKKTLLGFAGVSLLGILAAVLTGSILDPSLLALLQPLLAKLQFQAGSGTLRLQYLELALDIFSQRPVFGVGVGTYYGATLLGTLLAETGIVGFSVFVLAHITAYWDCLRMRDSVNSQTFSISVALVVSSATLLGTVMLAKSISTLLFPWFWLSLALPTALSLQKRGGKVTYSQVKSTFYSLAHSTGIRLPRE